MTRNHTGRAGGSLLAALAPFDGWTDGERRPLDAHTDRLRPRPGTVVARAGTPAREAVAVVAGHVTARGGPLDGRRFGPGSWLGGDELLAGRAHAATLVAGRDLEVVVVNGPAFRWAAQTHPDLLRAVPTDQPG
jgi:CRP-like cAMP-binding protein